MGQLAVIFASSFVIALSGALMPGPMFAAAVSGGMQDGPAAGPLLILGHALLEGALLIALFFGLAPILSSETAFIGISILGALILGWMSLGMFRSLKTLRLSLEAGEHKRGGYVLSGIVYSVVNPYWSIWWATIGLGYVIQARAFGLLGVFVFFTGHIAADFLWYIIVSYAAARGRFFFSDRMYRGVVGACAAVLAVFACLFGYKGIESLLA